jgi:hypothetical protein
MPASDPPSIPLSSPICYHHTSFKFGVSIIHRLELRSNHWFWEVERKRWEWTIPCRQQGTQKTMGWWDANNSPGPIPDFRDHIWVPWQTARLHPCGDRLMRVASAFRHQWVLMWRKNTKFVFLTLAAHWRSKSCFHRIELPWLHHWILPMAFFSLRTTGFRYGCNLL